MSSTTENTKTTETGSTPKAAKTPKAPKTVASATETAVAKPAKAPKAVAATKAVKTPKAPKEGAVATPAKAARSAAVAAPEKAPKAVKAPKTVKAAALVCPCGTGQSLVECCGPILAGTRPAPTAEALMRSRYSAYATGDIAYLRKSLDARWQKDFDEQATLEWSKNAQWQGLTVVDTKDGGPADEEGIVEFIAAFNMDGQDQKIRERAQFKRQGGVWYYVDGKVKSTQETVVSGPKVGRNDPCPCGSGKKYKKCCA